MKYLNVFVATLLAGLGVSQAAEPQIVSGYVEVKTDRSLSREQKQELYLEGTITDAEGNVWDVRTIPGTSSIRERFKKGWKDAGDDFVDGLGDSKRTFILLTKRKFYTEDVAEVAKDGIHYAREGAEFTKDALEWTWESFSETFYQGIGDDWKEAAEKNREASDDRSIGWQFQIVKNVLIASGYTLGRTVWAPTRATMGLVGAAGGATFMTGATAYAGVAPVVYVVAVPVWGTARPVLGGLESLYDILGNGSLVPGSLYVWNGGAWLVSKNGNVPTHETYWIELKRNADDQPRTLMVDRDAFAAIVQASLLTSMTQRDVERLETEKEPLVRQRDEVQKMLNEIYNQIERKESEIRNTQVKLEQSPAYRKTQDMTWEAQNPNVKPEVASDVKAIMIDDAALGGIIRSAAAISSVELTDEQVSQIAALVRETMSKISRDEPAQD